MENFQLFLANERFLVDPNLHGGGGGGGGLADERLLVYADFMSWNFLKAGLFSF